MLGDRQSARQGGGSSGLGSPLALGDVVQFSWRRGWLMAVLLAVVAVAVNGVGLVPGPAVVTGDGVTSWGASMPPPPVPGGAGQPGWAAEPPPDPAARRHR